MKKRILFDCDSTLSAIEGVDEMARLRGEEVYAKIEELTRLAMEGRIALAEAFERRLEWIRPTRGDIETIARAYIERVEPDAKAVVAELAGDGWESGILSGGCRQAILPLARFLGIELVEAVDFYFRGDGSYESFDRDSPATRNGGKEEIIRRLRGRDPERIVMVGDGVSDLETRPAVDLFIGFGGFVVREPVKREAVPFIYSLREIPSLLRSF